MIHSIHNFSRLCRRRSVLRRFNHSVGANSDGINENDGKKQNKDLKQLYNQYKDKIVFNSYLEREKLELGSLKYHVKKIKKAKDLHSIEFKEKSLPPLPVALQYYVDKERLLPDNSVEVETEQPPTFQLPFTITTQVEIDDNESQCDTIEQNLDSNKFAKTDPENNEFDRSNIKRWMSNYEYFNDSELKDDVDEENIDLDWSKHYGTPDPSVRISRVPCGGCGALLHCNDPAIPGYLPSELFVGRIEKQLKTMDCQRCHFLKEYNIALGVTVEPEEYEQLLHSIRRVKSLVLLMVDLLDFPCSLWPGIVDIIGKERPLFIVANKVDLVPGDSIGYLKRIEQSLRTEINKTKLREGNIKHVALISAKTGYGVENLITVMFRKWAYKGDVFLVGCTNVGKSSLFNALLQSDYCKVHAVDIVKRATVSRWPGTTLNLLKFPINRPTGWKLSERLARLKAETKVKKVENEIRKGQLLGQKVTESPALIGHIGRTFTNNIATDGIIAEKLVNMETLNEKHEVFAQSKWFYDTPGVIHPDQVLSLLSTEELLLTIPKTLIKPQTYYLSSDTTLFIAGLARVDLVECPEPCRFTVYCSEHLPLTVTKTENADEVYDQFLGTELTAVPTGGSERLKKWPGLKKKDDLLEFFGQGPKLCCGDIVLSSIAWMSVTAKKDSRCVVAAWTPEGRGVHQRLPSLLPFAINLKGKRVRDTPAYRLGKIYSD